MIQNNKMNKIITIKMNNWNIKKKDVISNKIIYKYYKQIIISKII